MPHFLLRRVLVYSHRWLGIALSMLFVAWFMSGIVMMYARMPRLTPEERLMRLAPLDLSAATVDPAAAASSLTAPVQRLRIGMLRGRPAYRFLVAGQWTTVFADTGERLGPLAPEESLDIARRFFPEHARALVYDARLIEPDQWTLQVQGLLPAHRVRLGDPARSVVYISERTAEPVLLTTRSDRSWGYVGAVVHWIYFTPIRRRSAEWAQLIIWTSMTGAVLCAIGVVWGIWRFSTEPRYRLRGRARSRSPYAGMMRWHHVAGLIFGAVTFTWVFSGLLSMNPWDWSPGTGPTVRQREAFSGGPFAPAGVTISQLRHAADLLGQSFPIKELELLQFRGALVAQAYRAPDPTAVAHRRLGEPGDVVGARLALEHRLVFVADVTPGAFTRFDDQVLLDAARDAMPGIPIEEAVSIDDYDAYYYDRHRQLPLPVLRLKYADEAATWLYVDPFRGSILRKEERLTRLNRWLYHGLHSLDFPWLYHRRPLWDIVVIALSVGGIVVSVSSAPAALGRLRRHARRIVSRPLAAKRGASRRRLDEEKREGRANAE